MEELGEVLLTTKDGRTVKAKDVLKVVFIYLGQYAQHPAKFRNFSITKKTEFADAVGMLREKKITNRNQKQFQT